MATENDSMITYFSDGDTPGAPPLRIVFEFNKAAKKFHAGFSSNSVFLVKGTNHVYISNEYEIFGLFQSVQDAGKMAVQLFKDNPGAFEGYGIEADIGS